MSKTITFEGQIVIPDDTEEAAFNNAIGWTPKVTLEDDQVVDNPMTQKAALHDWIRRTLANRITRSKRYLAESGIVCTSDITVE